MGKLDGKKVAILVAPEGIEQVELTEPRKALEEAGAQVSLLSTETGEVQAFNHLDKADTFPVDQAVGEAQPDAFDALMLPGGVANPDALRMDQDAVRFIKGFFEAGKPVAAICHAPWMLIEAGLARRAQEGSRAVPDTDLRHGGGPFVDEEGVTGS